MYLPLLLGNNIFLLSSISNVKDAKDTKRILQYLHTVITTNLYKQNWEQSPNKVLNFVGYIYSM